MRQACQVTLVWIPSHVGIPGNDRVDRIANKARNSNNRINTKLASTELKSRIKQHILDEWEIEWATSDKGRIAFEIIGKPTLKAKITENNKIPANKYITRLRLGKTRFTWEEPTCSECDEQNTIRHYIILQKPVICTKRQHSMFFTTVWEDGQLTF